MNTRARQIRVGLTDFLKIEKKKIQRIDVVCASQTTSKQQRRAYCMVELEVVLG